MGRRGYRRFLVGATMVLLPLLAACTPTEHSTLAPKTQSARDIYELMQILFIAGVIVFVLVEAALIYTIFAFRERREIKGLASQSHGNTKLEIAWTIAPALLVAFLATMTYRTQAKVTSFPENPFIVKAIGHQWWWEFQYPELGIYTANDLYLPVNRDIQVDLTSVDVIHSFWVPRLMGKTDNLPGHTNRLWFRTEEVGEYLGHCAEFCGEQHAIMRFRVLVQEPTEFDTWVAAMKTAPATPPASAGICQGCHAFDATRPIALGPNLRNYGDRPTIGAGAAPNDPANLKRWLHNPEEVKSGNFMSTQIKPNTLTDQQIEELTNYLLSLKAK